VQNLLYENEFDLHENEHVCGTHFHMYGFERRLLLTQTQKSTQKWSIGARNMHDDIRLAKSPPTLALTLQIVNVITNKFPKQQS